MTVCEDLVTVYKDHLTDCENLLNVDDLTVCEDPKCHFRQSLNVAQ